MGADRGAHILTDTSLLPLNIAKLLAAVVKKESASLCLLGKQAIDDDCNQTGMVVVSNCFSTEIAGAIEQRQTRVIRCRADACCPFEVASGNLCLQD